MTSQRIVAVMAEHFFFVEFFNLFGILHENALLSLLFLLFSKNGNHLANFLFVSEVTMSDRKKKLVEILNPLIIIH
jgi:uncharacterized membrane protein